MSGTSLDGVDAALIEFKQDNSLNLIKTHSHPIPTELRFDLINATQPDWKGSFSDFGILNQKLGKLFSEASNQLLRNSNFNKNHIHAIGSHGQTLWHQPDGEFPFSLQLGDANLIAESTGITTVADFRSRDIAAGGQGAPLVPAFHKEYLSSPNKSRVILNIGGISNITILPSEQLNTPVKGFDTGPGNTLLDAWIRNCKKLNYDKNGSWASSGKVLHTVLEKLLDDPFFALPSPKSTGKELFNINWLEARLNNLLYDSKPEDIQATLNELTVKSISDNIPENCDEIYICGGGIHNLHLTKTLQGMLPKVAIASTEALGINPDWMEAIAFSWLAKQTIDGKPGNLSDVTGAKGARILGAIYPSS